MKSIPHRSLIKQMTHSGRGLSELQQLIEDSTGSISQRRPLLIISHQATLTGAPAVVQDLGYYLAALGCKIVYLIIEPGTQIDAYRQIGDVYLLSEFENNPEKAAAELVRRYRPLAAVCNTITTTRYASLLKAESNEIRILGWVHEMPTVINSFFGGEPTAREAFTSCDKLLFGSEFVQDRFAKEYGLAHNKLGILPYIRRVPLSTSKPVISSGLELANAVNAISNDDDGQLLIIGCGTAEPRKGLDIFVRIADLILKSSPPSVSTRVLFEWFGCPSYNDNYVDFCKLDAKQLGIDRHISFNPVTPGFLDRLNVATVFVLTSREDPYPLVILDSMARKVPFVCFENAGGAADLACIGAGAAVPYGDEQAFAHKVIDLLDNPSKRSRMGNAGIKRILEVNNWKRVVSCFWDHLYVNKQIINEIDTKEVQHGNIAVCNDSREASQDIRSKKWLVVSFGPPPLPHIEAVEGGGLRCWNLARGIHEVCNSIDLTLTYPGWYDQQNSIDSHCGIHLARWGNEEELISQTLLADVVVVSFCYGDYSLKIARALRASQKLILDCYVPIHVEMCARRSPNRDREADAYEIERIRWEQVLKRGDLFLCSNTNQLHYYRGILYQIGRLNPHNYDNDPLVVAPFGISGQRPTASTHPIDQLGAPSEARRILWFGGVYPWFSIECLFEAVEILNLKSPCVLIVVGVRNPFNGHPDFIRQASEIEDLAQSDRFKGRVFLADWVKYEERADWFLDSNLLVMISSNGVENEYAWRTRLVDYLWAGVHVATSGQDVLSKEMISCGLASELRLDTPSEIAASLDLALRRSASMHAFCSKDGEALKESLDIAYIGGTVLDALIRQSEAGKQ